MSDTLSDSRGVLPPIPALIPIDNLNETIDPSRDVNSEQAPRHRRHRNKSRRRSEREREEPPVPRVNPIFLWVKQEDTRIVEVRCEDYDKRNRIRLTKTPHGWRAIPRTETLLNVVPKRKHKKKKKHKVVTVEAPSSPVWNSPVNIESHLPSHTIAKKDEKSPLDNLLEVAEFEFNSSHEDVSIDLTEQHKEFFENIVQLNKLLESRTAPEVPKIEPVTVDYNEDDENHQLEMDDIITRLEQSLQSPQEPKEIEDVQDVDKICEEVTTNIITTISKDTTPRELTPEPEPIPVQPVPKQSTPPPEPIEKRLPTPEPVEQSIPTLEPHYLTPELPSEPEPPPIIKIEEEEPPTESPEFNHSLEELTENITEPLQELSEKPILEELPQETPSISDKVSQDSQEEMPCEDETEDIQNPIDSTTDDLPTDLSMNRIEIREEVPSEAPEETDDEIEDEMLLDEEDDLPTDLSIPKRLETPRPPSHSSETIQSPQPSGIPAVPPSPDIFPPTTSFNNQKPNKFLESLLSSSPKLCVTPEVTITRQSQPLDLGKNRKSASPTVTCSSEAVEPNPKRLKLEDITLKNLLHKTKKQDSRLLQLLTNDDPLTQFKNLLADPDIVIPDPLLVPKDRLNNLILAPITEIPKLLTERPELRLPEALAYPQLLQNPDILVISTTQFQSILQKHGRPERPERPEPKVKPKPTSELLAEKPNPKKPEIDPATTAAFNQMLWLPYLNQLEAASMANNNEFLKALSSVFPSQPTPPIFNEFNYNFPLLPPPAPLDYNNIEMALWQESLLKSQQKPYYRNELFVDTRPREKPKPKPTSARTSPITPHRFDLPYLNPYPNYPQWTPKTPSPRITSSTQPTQPTPPTQHSQPKPHFIPTKPPKPKEKPKSPMKPRLQCKSLQNLLSPSRLSAEAKNAVPTSSTVFQPMDLSPPFNHLYQHYPGMMHQMHPQGKIKVKSNLMKPRDEVPEVGSTTSSLEDIHHHHHGVGGGAQDAQNHLWHPLFGK